MKKDFNGLVELTPQRLRCFVGQCPAVYAEANSNDLIIIGKLENIPALACKVGSGEAVIRIDRAYFDEAILKTIRPEVFTLR